MKFWIVQIYEIPEIPNSDLPTAGSLGLAASRRSLFSSIHSILFWTTVQDLNIPAKPLVLQFKMQAELREIAGNHEL